MWRREGGSLHLVAGDALRVSTLWSVQGDATLVGRLCGPSISTTYCLGSSAAKSLSCPRECVCVCERGEGESESFVNVCM